MCSQCDEFETCNTECTRDENEAEGVSFLIPIPKHNVLVSTLHNHTLLMTFDEPERPEQCSRMHCLYLLYETHELIPAGLKRVNES